MQWNEIKGASFFKEQKRGFDKEQVESYVQRVADEYRDMYAEYVSLLNKCSEFTETCLKLTKEKAASDEAAGGLQAEIAALRGNVLRLTEELESAKREEQRTDAPSEAISKALIDAEVLAREITDAARLEAARILEEASRETARIQGERDWAIVEIQNIQNKLVAFASASA
ncbi:MAG: DivIVA domain-containing protein [Oscillospiraceae bacterium]|nr:DivIVA domain-containing protein [Oscillospiraceae bacterium]